ncbi:putative DNA breaking-rejoining enzyme [Lyophyllum shimeji]|uniref:DNA breaking-rejoining enzyme n=1 Tax=Lyophyllum shimeji TaxID=47721 RepID=A0A9P3UUI5_LYOSH|nr:putative DNA breaking-rejoining enzyme [Lyophyllum shimeji]
MAVTPSGTVGKSTRTFATRSRDQGGTGDQRLPASPPPGAHQGPPNGEPDPAVGEVWGNVEPSQPVVAESPAEASNEILKTFQEMTPQHFAALMKVGPLLFGGVPSGAGVGGESVEANDGLGERKLLWTSEMERPAGSLRGKRYEVPACLVDLLASRIHLPLTLLTPTVIEDFHTNPATIKWIKITGADGKTRTVVDVGKYPRETSLPPGQFHEAWDNLLSADYLMGVEKWEENYESTLLFDIDVRRQYLATRQAFLGPTYYDRHNRIISRVTQEKAKAAISALAAAANTSTAAPRRSDSSGARYSPYGSFPEGRSGGPNPTCCFICGEHTHRAPDCPVPPPPDVAASMSAHSAGARTTAVALARAKRRTRVTYLAPSPVDFRAHDGPPTPSGNPELDVIVTPYNVGAFNHYMSIFNLHDAYPNLLDSLRYGFKMGNFPELTRSITPENHATSPIHLDFLLQYCLSEVDVGRMSGPFSYEDALRFFGGPFRTSPLGIVEKAGSPGKFRAVQDLSFAGDCGFSINDCINKFDYQTSWGTAASVADLVAEAPPGTRAGSLDIVAAFRTCPVWPPHKKFFALRVRDVFFADHCCCFGCTSSGGCQGQVADCVLHILERKGFGPSRKWVDDIVQFSYPSSGDGTPQSPFVYPYEINDIIAATADLGVPWHPDKLQQFGHTVVYLGFLWDLRLRTVSLPEHKRLKFKGKVDDFLATFSAARAPRKVAVSLHGSLSHISFVYPYSRSRLPNLSAFLASFGDRPFAPRYPSRSLVSDLRWWSSILAGPSDPRPLRPRAPPADLGVWVDASTSWGIGIIIGKRWAAWKLLDGWDRSPGCDIGWAEGVAVELVVSYLVGTGCADVAVIIRSDNRGVIGAYNRGRGRNFQVNLSIQRAETVARSANVTFTLDYVESAANLADPISRGDTFDMSRRDDPVLRALTRVRAAAAAVRASTVTPQVGLARTSRAVVAKTKKARSSTSTRAAATAISPSVLRPPVRAGERLHAWVTPHSFHFVSGISHFAPPHLISKLFLTALNSLAPKTREVYGAGLLRFHQFCDRLAVPESARMPASPTLLATFCASWAGFVARDTVDNWMSGLRFWHIFHGADWHGDHLLLSAVKKGVANMAPESSKRPPRPPVTLEHMHALFRGLDLSNSLDAAVWAVASVAFWCCCRLGELVVPSCVKFDPAFHASRASANPRFSSVTGGCEYASFRVPWTKTTNRKGATITVTDNGEILSPYLALKHHLDANAGLPANAPLFAFESGDTASGWAPLTREWFLERCNAVWSATGLARVSGHSFRIGGATELLLRGTPPDIVRVLGRWESQAFLLYWRKVETILPKFLSGALLSSRLAQLRDSMERFRVRHNLPQSL